jgi:hypothetical protein
MDISPGGELFVTGDNDGLLKVGDTKDGSIMVGNMIFALISLVTPTQYFFFYLLYIERIKRTYF